MKKLVFQSLFVLLAAMVFTSCSKPLKMKDAAKEVSVVCDPPVLEAKAAKVEAQYTVTFPQKWFHKKGMLEMTPYLVYEGGEVAAPVKKVQGAKINDNFEVVSEQGGRVSQRVQFDYKPGMEKSHLELRVKVIYKGKQYPFDEPYKLADGVITTYMLADLNGVPVYADNDYQKIITQQQKGQVKFVINQADVRKSELSKGDIKELEKFIAEAEKNPRAEYKGMNIKAYASPDGGEKINEPLSANRGKNTKKVMTDWMKQSKVQNTAMDVKNIAEDWEGFRELVAASNIEDKDLILRVLSMYNDSGVREREIKNMSKIYLVLAEKVLPELRRSQMVATVEVQNYTDNELRSAVSSNSLSNLDVEALLYTATLYTDNATKIKLYQAATQKGNDYRAYNNLAVAYLMNGDVASAESALKSADASNPVVKNNLGVVALRKGNMTEAAGLFASASGLPQAKQNEGACAIAAGEYDKAVSNLSGTKSFNEGLALYLTGKSDAAQSILNGVDDARADYLKAVIAARAGRSVDVGSNLTKAFAKDASLKARAQKDIEFAKYQNAVQ